MKFPEFLSALKRAAINGHASFFDLHAEISDEVRAMTDKYGKRMLAQLNVVGVIRNGLELSAEAHAAVQKQRDESQANAEAMVLGVRYTVRVDGVPAALRTEWHPTEDTGPFATLDRGAFFTPEEAIEWARTHLNGTPYTLVEI